MNNFCGGGGSGEEISILKCSFSLLKKFQLHFLWKKNLARWPDINCRHCSSAFRSFVDVIIVASLRASTHVLCEFKSWIFSPSWEKTGAHIQIKNIERDKEKGSKKEFALMLSVSLRSYVARNFYN